MTDYIEWILETAEDEEERGAPWDDGRRNDPLSRPGADSSPIGGAGRLRAGRGTAPLPGDGGDRSVSCFARDGAPRRGAETPGKEGVERRGRRSTPDYSWGLPQSALWADSSLGEGAFGAAGLDFDGIGLVRGLGMEGSGFMDGVRRTATAASALARRGAAGRTVVETETVPSPAADPAALDLVFQRDARRYDGAFTLY